MNRTSHGATVPATTAEVDRPVLQKRVCWDVEGAHVIADTWDRDRLAYGMRAHSTQVFPREVTCNRHTFTLYIVIAYGFLPNERPADAVIDGA